MDYTVEDFTRKERRYDLILNVAGNRSVPDVRRALAPEGTLVIVGGAVGREQNGGGMLGVLALMIKGRLFSRFVRQRVFMFIGKIRKGDLVFLTELIEGNVVDARYAVVQMSYSR